MSGLSDFRDHCRRMATAEHKPECPSLGPKSRPVWESVYEDDSGMPCALRLAGFTEPPPRCSGCNSPEDQAMFARLADEVDDYRSGDLVLFGDQP
jgi:hypothetical protein